MNSRFYGILSALAVATFAACAEDPTTSLRGGPSTITINPDPLVVTHGSSATIDVVVRDDQLNGLPVPLSVTGGSAAVTVTPSTVNPDPTGVYRRYVVTGVSPAATTVNAAAGGATKNGIVAVLPQTFNGTLNPASPQVGQALTFTAAAPLAFGSADVDFGDGLRGIITGQNATSLTVIVPQPDGANPRALTIENLAVSGVAGLSVAVPTGPVNVVNPYDPNDTPGTTSFTVPIPGEFYDGFVSATCADGVGPACDNFYTITLTATTTLTALLEWDTDADLDLLWCNAACSALVGNLSGATGANPETSTVTLAAGTYNLWINAWDNHDEPAHIYKLTITTP